MTARPVRSAIVPGLLALVAALGLWRSMDRSTVALGAAVGAMCGGLAGWVMAHRPRQPETRVLGLVRWVATGAVAAALLFAGAAAVTGRAGAGLTVPERIATFLSVGMPVVGLGGLVVVPFSVAALTALGAVWAELLGRSVVAVAVALVGLLSATLGVGARGVPWWVSAAFMALVAVGLVAVSRNYSSELPPLEGSPSAIRRNHHWWRPAAVIVPATLIGSAMSAVPTPEPFNVRQFVEPNVFTLIDENPLAVAARWRSADAPVGADDVDISVTVSGPSPGRLRLAVLEAYSPEGWQQQATFAVTGNYLGADWRLGDLGVDLVSAEVLVVDAAGRSGMRAVPTAGRPIELESADGVRHSVAAGLLATDNGDVSVAYRTVPELSPARDRVVAAPAAVSGVISECADSALVVDLAATLTSGIEAPLDRLDAIGAWLKLRHIYDVDASGGQTIGSVERFLSREYSIGNLEVFVSAYALMARCADVPVRVVVGYPAPAADTTTVLRPRDVSAWLETPIAGVGWISIDALPTPVEVDASVQLAQADPPPSPEEQRAEPQQRRDSTQRVDAVPPEKEAVDWSIVLARLAVIVAAVVSVAMIWATFVRHRTVERRSRVADPALAVLFAWVTVIERLRDKGVDLAPHHTASESARSTEGRVPAPVTMMIAELARLVDHARFDGDRSTAEHAGAAWGLTREMLRTLPTDCTVFTAPLRAPRRAIARSRLTRGQLRNRRPWTGTMPASDPDEQPGQPVIAPIPVGDRSASGDRVG